MEVKYICLTQEFEKPFPLVCWEHKGGLVADRFDACKHTMSDKDLHRMFADVKGYRRDK